MAQRWKHQRTPVRCDQNIDGDLPVFVCVLPLGWGPPGIRRWLCGDSNDWRAALVLSLGGRVDANLKRRTANVVGDAFVGDQERS